MANSLFRQLNGGAANSQQNHGNAAPMQQNPFGGMNPLDAFGNFMQTMRGQDPGTVINQMLSSGQITQDQLSAVQQRAQMIEGRMAPLKRMFGFR